MIKRAVAILTAITITASSPASAAIVLAATNSTSTAYSGSSSALKLTDSGATSLTFNAKAGETLAISVTVECQFFASSDQAVESGFVALVDGVSLAPSGLSVACSQQPNGTPLANTTTQIYVYEATSTGPHSITEQFNSGATTAVFKTSLLIFR